MKAAPPLSPSARPRSKSRYSWSCVQSRERIAAAPDPVPDPALDPAPDPALDWRQIRAASRLQLQPSLHCEDRMNQQGGECASEGGGGEVARRVGEPWVESCLQPRVHVHVDAPRRRVAEHIRPEPIVQSEHTLGSQDGPESVHEPRIARQPNGSALLHVEARLDQVKRMQQRCGDEACARA
eukprot:CAMPEP_0181234654 /NCGR_PEP_ID=MMETSP1096-20121128/37098_1 /TAXON_ID=156174 ORGANISM="Chrysochromulina ericina, Strain CCMP281" /NCGR_SAMPLE_ID=MMETSP1096 /ASSEMBLY_ACC=CAM_ASM_000453 /LENGTH=181 /DNA_ID=CAMNT_0023329463 /DNA_START=956 /DNA_END=1505 /DNA_ORIENTATION=-